MAREVPRVERHDGRTGGRKRRKPLADDAAERSQTEPHECGRRPHTVVVVVVVHSFLGVRGPHTRVVAPHELAPDGQEEEDEREAREDADGQQRTQHERLWTPARPARALWIHTHAAYSIHHIHMAYTHIIQRREHVRNTGGNCM